MSRVWCECGVCVCGGEALTLLKIREYYQSCLALTTLMKCRVLVSWQSQSNYRQTTSFLMKLWKIPFPVINRRNISKCIEGCQRINDFLSVWILPEYTPPESLPPCSRAAAATCPSAEPRCTHHTFYNHHPEGLVWPSADPGQVLHRQCR